MILYKSICFYSLQNLYKIKDINSVITDINENDIKIGSELTYFITDKLNIATNLEFNTSNYSSVIHKQKDHFNVNLNIEYIFDDKTNILLDINNLTKKRERRRISDNSLYHYREYKPSFSLRANRKI